MMMIGGQKLERFRFFCGSMGRYGLGSKVMGVLCFVPNQLFSCTHSKAVWLKTSKVEVTLGIPLEIKVSTLSQRKLFK